MNSQKNECKSLNCFFFFFLESNKSISESIEIVAILKQFSRCLFKIVDRYLLLVFFILENNYSRISKSKDTNYEGQDICFFGKQRVRVKKIPNKRITQGGMSRMLCRSVVVCYTFKRVAHCTDGIFRHVANTRRSTQILVDRKFRKNESRCSI